MKNSLTKKLLLAVITLGIAVIATVGSTYAWFSMNTTVEATGMQLTAVTPVNVVISKTKNDGFGPSVEFTTQTAKLLPASTTLEQLTSSGVSFWAVKEGQVIGSNGQGGKATAGSNGTKFQTDVKSSATPDNVGRSYFIKEDLYLKTTAGRISLVLEDIVLGDVTNEVLTSGGTVESAATIGSPATTYEIKDALYVALITDQKTLVYRLGDDGSFKGVTSVASDGTFTTAGSDTQISTTGSNGTLVFDSAAELTSLGTDPQHVQVVVWLEGEDPECVNAIGGLGLTIGLVFGYKEGSFVAE